MNHSLILAVAVCLLTVGNVRAQDTSDLDKCVSDQPSTIAQSSCLYAIYKKEDVLLNVLYKKAMVQAHNVDAGTAAELKKSQRAWVTMRDGWCTFQARWEGGTLARLAQPFCLALTTRRRNNELTFYAGEGSPAPQWKK